MDLTSLRGTGASDDAGPVQAGPAPPAPTSAAAGRAGPPSHRRLLAVGVGMVVVAGVVLRFAARSHLWLDEALTVNVAQLPLGEIPRWLRHDGSPPLYYFLLHGWTGLFGTTALAARSLSGVLSVAALPLMWRLGRRVGGRNTAWVALVLLVSSPFAVRYATEARMYALVVLLVLAGHLALLRVLEAPARGASLALGLVTGLLLLTHYWALYLLAAVGGLLSLEALRGSNRGGARRALVATAAGSLLLLPWLPGLWFQLRHTGTPWIGVARVKSLFDTVVEFAGGYRDQGQALALILSAFIGLAVFGRPLDGRRVELDLRTRPQFRPLAVVALLTPATAIVVSWVSGAGYSARYASVVLPPFLLLAALGTGVLTDRRLRSRVVALAAVLGLLGAVSNVRNQRTQAGKVAAALEAQGRPGDVVVYCPDQLGPSVSRLLDDRFVQLTFPSAGPPQLVDWVDYGKRNRAASTADFGRQVVERTPPDRNLWLVWATGYRTFGTKCQNLLGRLSEARPDATRVVKISTKYFERMGLVRFRPQ